MMENRDTPHPKAEDFRRYFEDAGFVDINVIEKLIDIGGWSGGLEQLCDGQS